MCRRAACPAQQAAPPRRPTAPPAHCATVTPPQVHNGREKPIAIHWREWSFLDARGVLHTESGVGLGGLKEVGKVRLQPGQALQYQGTFELPTRTGIAAGRYAVALDEDDPDRTTYDIVIAPMGVSTDGRPVPPIEPLRGLTPHAL